VLIFSDEDVPEPIPVFLEARGHSVQRTRHVLVQGAKDPTIASLASDKQAVVVTFNFGHFLGHAKRRYADGSLIYPGMSVIAFECEKPLGLQRLAATIDEIEAIYELRVGRRQGRMIAVVKKNSLRFDD
jgi:hypothetical protein